MRKLRIDQVNKAIRAQVGNCFELVRGNGYFYIVYDDGNMFDTKSIWVPRLTDLPIEIWLKEAIDFRNTLE